MLLSELEFGAFLSYSPRGLDELARESRSWAWGLKDERLVGGVPMSRSVAQGLRDHLSGTPLVPLFSQQPVLVPVPGSTRLASGGRWTARSIATALVEVGLGRAVIEGLERATTIPKSSRSAPDQRPTAARHYETMRVTRITFTVADVLLVDDVVTRGATLLGAASRLREVLPVDVRIRGFAVYRALSNPSEFQRILDPQMGRIVLRNDGSTLRRP